MEVTKREIGVSISILSIMVGIGIWISNPIVAALTENALEVASAVQVYDPENLDYIKRTNVGNFLAEGDLIAQDTIRLAEFPGEFSRIVKITEEYCEHVETYQETDEKGNVVTKTRVYHSWDEKDRKDYKSNTFCFLGYIFTSDELKYNVSTTQSKTVYPHWWSDIRYNYYTTPLKVHGIVKGQVMDDCWKKLKFKRDCTIKQAVEKAERNTEVVPVVFWIAWLILTAIFICIFYAFENRWLY